MSDKMPEKFITKKAKETQKLGHDIAVSLRAPLRGAWQSRVGATVFCLRGDLGGGKTTFLQGFAKGLGINDKILSPTFVILKKFRIAEIGFFQYFYHFDCYRIGKPEEILELGFAEIISNPKNIVAIEWPERIKKYLPKNSIKIKFKFIDEQIRELTIKK